MKKQVITPPERRNIRAKDRVPESTCAFPGFGVEEEDSDSPASLDVSSCDEEEESSSDEEEVHRRTDHNAFYSTEYHPGRRRHQPKARIRNGLKDRVPETTCTFPGFSVGDDDSDEPKDSEPDSPYQFPNSGYGDDDSDGPGDHISASTCTYPGFSLDENDNDSVASLAESSSSGGEDEDGSDEEGDGEVQNQLPPNSYPGFGLQDIPGAAVTAPLTLLEEAQLAADAMVRSYSGSDFGPLNTNRRAVYAQKRMGLTAERTRDEGMMAATLQFPIGKRLFPNCTSTSHRTAFLSKCSRITGRPYKQLVAATRMSLCTCSVMAYPNPL